MKAVLVWCGIYASFLMAALLIHEIPVHSHQTAVVYGLVVVVNLGLVLLIKYRA